MIDPIWSVTLGVTRGLEMACTDCGGGTPNHWKRCEDCAYARCRSLMSGVARTVKDKSKFSCGDSVVVKSSGKQGIVKRRKDDQYTVVFPDKTRTYVPFTELSLVPEAAE